MAFDKTLRTQLAAQGGEDPRREKGRRRTHDPDSSKEAAERVDARSLVEQCYGLLRQAGRLGMTSSEMAEALGVGRDTISPRLPTLRDEYGVVNGGVKRDRQIVWTVSDTKPRMNRPTPPAEKTKGTGAVKFQGEVVGHVKKATLTLTKRELKHDLFLGDCDNIADALRSGRGSWCFDLGLMETLYERGVLFVEVPTTHGLRFRAKMETVLGPLGFDRTDTERPLACLNLKHWTELNDNDA